VKLVEQKKDFPPYEVGIYTANTTRTQNLEAAFEYFRVTNASKGKLHTDEFDGPLPAFWKHRNLPDKTSISCSKGWLYIKAKPNTTLFRDDCASKYWQITDSQNFDIETHVTAQWRYTTLSPGKYLIFLPFLLMIIPFAHASRNKYDILFLSLFLAPLLAYLFHAGRGTIIGYDSISSRYYSESIFLGIIPLSARGILIIYNFICAAPQRQRFPRHLFLIVKISIILIVCGLLLNTLLTYYKVYTAQQKSETKNYLQNLAKFVDDLNIKHAVIFIPNSREAPLGDYPFSSLAEANIVYFHLGPDIPFALPKRDWQTVYKKYFKGRKAYLYISKDASRCELVELPTDHLTSELKPEHNKGLKSID
jgi:hypothetical protein